MEIGIFTCSLTTIIVIDPLKFERFWKRFSKKA